MNGFNQTGHEVVFQDSQLTVCHDQFIFPDGSEGTRTVAKRPAAVAAVCLDEAGKIPLVRQWRAPIQRYLYELPAGKLDVEGEDPTAGIARELAEEAQLKAEHYQALTTLDITAGWADERITIYLATGLSPAALPEGFVLEAEEADMTVEWVPLADAVTMCTDGRITDAKTIAGILLTQQHIASQASR